MTCSTGSGGESRRTGRGQSRPGRAARRAGRRGRRCARARRFRPRRGGGGGARRGGRRAGRSAGRDRARAARRPARRRSAAAPSGSTRAAIEAEALDAEAGLDRLDLRAEQPAQMGAVAGGAGEADRHMLLDHCRRGRRARTRRRTPRPASARAGTRRRTASAAGLRDRLGGGDRLEEAQQDARAALRGRSDRTARRRGPAPDRGGASKSRAEAALERRARHGDQLADPLEAEPAGGGRARPRRGAARRAAWRRAPRPRRPAGQRMSGAPPKRARACAAPAVPATAMRAVKPSRAAEGEDALAHALARRRTDGRRRSGRARGRPGRRGRRAASSGGRRTGRGGRARRRRPQGRRRGRRGRRRGSAPWRAACRARGRARAPRGRRRRATSRLPIAVGGDQRASRRARRTSVRGARLPRPARAGPPWPGSPALRAGSRSLGASAPACGGLRRRSRVAALRPPDPVDRQIGQEERGEPRHRGPPTASDEAGRRAGGRARPASGRGRSRREGSGADGRAGDPPAGHGGRRGGQRIGAGLAPAAQQQGRRAASPRRRAGAGGSRPCRRGRPRRSPRRGRHGAPLPPSPPAPRRHCGIRRRSAAPASAPPARGRARTDRAAPAPTAPGPFPCRAREARGERGEEQGRGGIVAGRGRGGRRLVQRRQPARRRRAARRPRRSRTAARAAPRPAGPDRSIAPISSRKAARRASRADEACMRLGLICSLYVPLCFRQSQAGGRSEPKLDISPSPPPKSAA